MSKHAISNEKESVGAIIKKFMHVIGINHRLCKWILPCNLGKNIIMAGLPYVGIVYGCNILNALVAREAKGHIMNMVYQLLVITFAMTWIKQEMRCEIIFVTESRRIYPVKLQA